MASTSQIGHGHHHEGPFSCKSGFLAIPQWQSLVLTLLGFPSDINININKAKCPKQKSKHPTSSPKCQTGPHLGDSVAI